MDKWIILGSDPMGKLQKKSPEIARLLANKLRDKESELIHSLDGTNVSSAPIIGSHINNNNRPAIIVNTTKGSIQGHIKTDIPIVKNELQDISILLQPLNIKIPRGDLVSIELKNGLGNRIFQILAAMKYAEMHNKKFVICKSLCIEGNKPHEKGLGVMLHRLFPKVEIIDSMPAYNVVKEKILFNYSPIDYCETNVVLSGYFQDHRYLPHKFTIPINRPRFLENTCFVHIRAGDYLLYTDEWGFDLNYYYQQCFEMIGIGVNFLVFSNDNIYADSYMKKFNVKYSISNTSNPLDVLLEMGSCAGGICANSTLSWIGAYIQEDKRGRIFMPSIWNNLRNCNGIYPPWATVVGVKMESPTIKLVEDITFVPNNTPKYLMLENKSDNHYGLMDIVIPVGPNDIEIINTQIIYTKANILYHRNIYLIHANTDLKIEGCTTVSENMFPFNMSTIEQLYGKTTRNGWYLQQLLKLYAGFIIPGILDRYLVVDSDTFFLKPTEFIKNGKCLYTYGKEYHLPYFDHMKRLHPSFKRVDKLKSGVCHHMMFDTSIIKEIINLVETYHRCKFYEIFLKSVTDIQNSGASEYELYFNYVLQNYPDGIILRTLEWENVDKLTKNIKNDFESLHWYIRDKSPFIIGSISSLPDLPKSSVSLSNITNSTDLYSIYDVMIINIPVYNRKNYNACIVNNRIFFRSVDRPGEDDIMTCEFNNLRCNAGTLRTLSLVSSFPNNKHVEDPRAIYHKGHWFVCYTDGYKVGIAKLDLQCNTIYSHYLNKPDEVKFEGGDGREKNWIPLSMGDSIQIWYSDNPRTIMVYEDTGSKLEYRRFFKTNQYIKCRFGNIRGGCPPIDYDENTKIWFFHTLFNRKYRIGAYLTRGLEVISITPSPILTGEHIVFPCGAIKNGNDFYISMGIQDRNVGILKISNAINFVPV
jgi:hypothetical protein